MDYHHVLEAAGTVTLGLVVYSYLVRWFESGSGGARRWRPVVTGLLFGLLAIVLMISRIHVGGDRFVDARAVPIALVGLVESTPAGAIAAGLAAAYRIWLGGSGMPAGLLGIAAIFAVSAGVRVWARRGGGGIGPHHALVLSVGVWAVTAGSFLLLGSAGAAMFAPVWLDFLAMITIGIVAGARLFGDVVAGQAAEAARRDAAQLRAVAALARMAAHEINNPLTAVMGGLALAQRSPLSADQTKWIENANRGAEQIRDIVKRMNRITQIEEVPSAGRLAPMLDIKKSSGPS